METVNIDFEFAGVYEDFIKDFLNCNHPRYSLYGGRNGGKSTCLYMMEILNVLSSGCVMVVRRYKANIQGSSYSGIISIINKYNLNSLFKIRKSPLQIQCISTGYTIDFAGLDSPDKLKSAVAQVGNYTLVVFEEAQEIINRNVCGEVISTFERGENSSGFRALYIFNPPPNRAHWVNTELRRDIPNYMRTLQVNYCDIPKEWVGQDLFEIERIKRENPKLYKYRYLGVPISAEDVVFENIKLQSITDNEIKQWEDNDDWVYTGLDFGYKPDKNACIACHYDYKNRMLYLYREFYQGELNNKQISDGLKHEGFNPLYRIICDCASPKDIQDLKKYGWNTKACSKGKGSVEAGFKWLQGLTGIVIDSKRCPNAAIEFQEYHYEVGRDGEVNNTFKWNQSDHTISAVRYGLEPVWKKAGL